MPIGFGTGSGRHRIGGRTSAPVAPPAPSPFAPPAGFALNGSTNVALKAMVARVKRGAGRGLIVWKGDSTTVGQGGGTTADGYGLTNARPNRPPAVLASLLSAAGVATLDNAMVGDNGMTIAGGFALAGYDARFAAGNGNFAGGLDFAGGSYRSPGTGPDSFTPDGPVDRFEVVIFNSNGYTLTFLIDGAAPEAITVAGATGSPAATVSGDTVNVATPGSGFTRLIITAAATHTLSWRANAMNLGAIRSVTGYASGDRAIDQLVHASLGASAAQQAASGNAWQNLDALGFDAPDLTIINLGLNDMNNAVSAASYQASLQALVAKGKASGDVLLAFPHPAAAPYNTNVAALRSAAADVAAASGVAFISLFDHFGGSFTPALQARMFDGAVHGNAGFCAEVAIVYRDCIRAMNGGVL